MLPEALPATTRRGLSPRRVENGPDTVVDGAGGDQLRDTGLVHGRGGESEVAVERGPVRVDSRQRRPEAVESGPGGRIAKGERPLVRLPDETHRQDAGRVHRENGDPGRCGEPIPRASHIAGGEVLGDDDAGPAREVEQGRPGILGPPLEMEDVTDPPRREIAGEPRHSFEDEAEDPVRSVARPRRSVPARRERGGRRAFASAIATSRAGFSSARKAVAHQ